MDLRIRGLVLLLTAAALPARAATITVTTAADELNADGDCALREAVEAANTDAPVDACAAGSGADVVSVPAGTYVLSLPGAEDANQGGDLDLLSSLSLQGAGRDATFLDGGGAHRVLDANPGNAAGLAIAVSGATVRNAQGGGIRSLRSFTLSESAVRDCATTGDGGGLAALLAADGELLAVSNVLFANNRADLTGGGLSVLAALGEARLENVVASGNQAGGAGGGLYVEAIGGRPVLAGIVAEGNAAGAEGGGAAVSVRSGGADLADVVAEDNVAGTDGGGVHFGIRSDQGSSLRRLQARDNRAERDGGGLYVSGVSVRDETVHEAFAAERNVAGRRGGGVYRACVACKGTFTDAAALDNVAAGDGGGLYLACVSCGGAVARLTAERNRAGADGGGAFFVGVASVGLSDLLLADNEAAGNGGGLAYAAVAAGDLRDVAATGNTAGSSGGGIYALGISGPNLRASRLLGNRADGAAPDQGGGGLFLHARAADVSLTRIAGNLAAGAGGGARLIGRSIDVERSLVEDNDAAAGGGISSLATSLDVVGSALARNTATADGGGLAASLTATPPEPTIPEPPFDDAAEALAEALLPEAPKQDFAAGVRAENTTFSANEAMGEGGGLYAEALEDLAGLESIVHLGHVAFAGGAAASGGSLYVASGAATPAAETANTIFGGAAAGGSCAGVPLASLGGNLDADGTCALAGAGDVSGVLPKLGPLANNGGATPTHALLDASPAIGLGDPAACLPTDQRDYPRDAACDAGPYERGAAPPSCGATVETAVNDDLEGTSVGGAVLCLRERAGLLFLAAAP